MGSVIFDSVNNKKDSVVDLWKQNLDNMTNSTSIDEYANGYISHFYRSTTLP
jgi:hypothetical protein